MLDAYIRGYFILRSGFYLRKSEGRKLEGVLRIIKKKIKKKMKNNADNFFKFYSCMVIIRIYKVFNTKFLCFTIVFIYIIK